MAGLVLAAGCYGLYHIGYGMEGSEMLFLFGYGLVFGAVFRLTKNVFVLWPAYTPIGKAAAKYSIQKRGEEHKDPCPAANLVVPRRPAPTATK